MKQEKNTLKFTNTPKGIIATLAEEIADNECITCFGIYWDDCDDMGSIGLDIVDEMIKQGKIKGSTYIEVMSTEFGVKHIELSNKDFEDIGYEYTKVDKEETKEVIRKYLKYIDKRNIDEYDNIICVIKDDPYYSNSGNDFVTTSVIVNSKNNDSFIVNVGLPQEHDFTKRDENEEKIMQKIKN